jgi:UDP-2,3-diacylglucosamine pyrophosphatase LpxH
MRLLIRFLLLKPILWIADRFSSAPDAAKVSAALTKLKEKLEERPGKKGFVIPFDPVRDKFIIFSDQHRGTKDGADDFMLAEPNYIAALEYYHQQGYHLISLGDAEELWENLWPPVKRANVASFEVERKFVERKAFTKIFGNHDLDWDIMPNAAIELTSIYGKRVAVLEGIMLQTRSYGDVFSIYCTHGHQGDAQSDGNWFSKFFISKVWAPLQSYLRINPNTPAYNTTLKTAHNAMMYAWSSLQKDLILITGHTHQPVFQSLTHLERLHVKRLEALAQNDHERVAQIESEIHWRKDAYDHLSTDFSKMKPSYFNTGCCCFDDGDITGIEIAEGYIRLIKWEEAGQKPKREVLEEASLEDIVRRLRG